MHWNRRLKVHFELHINDVGNNHTLSIPTRNIRDSSKTLSLKNCIFLYTDRESEEEEKNTPPKNHLLEAKKHSLA